MSNVLFIKANDRPAEQSVSISMYELFLNTYKKANPIDTIDELDLFQVNPPYYGYSAIEGINIRQKGLELTEGEKTAVQFVDQFLNQFLEAEKIVFAFPLWNGTVPSPLISYLSYITLAGKTFTYTSKGPIGLAGNKRVVLLHARGGDYSNKAFADQEIAIRYTKTLLGMIGVTDITTVVIEGHNQYKDRAKEIIADGLNSVVDVANTF